MLEADRAARTRDAGSQSRLVDALRDLLTRTHRAVYTWSGGLLGEWLGPLRALLLTTTGRRTGQSRVLPLAYFRDGDNLALIASNFGRPNPPAWWLNLQAHPAATVQIGRRVLRVRARQATPAEQGRIWQRAVRAYPPWTTYQRRVSRLIPVVILEPVE
jgi:deazaflavin-dependent oxidoreductase (nitroreductase family)